MPLRRAATRGRRDVAEGVPARRRHSGRSPAPTRLSTRHKRVPAKSASRRDCCAVVDRSKVDRAANWAQTRLSSRWKRAGSRGLSRNASRQRRVPVAKSPDTDSHMPNLASVTDRSDSGPANAESPTAHRAAGPRPASASRVRGRPGGRRCRFPAPGPRRPGPICKVTVHRLGRTKVQVPGQGVHDRVERRFRNEGPGPAPAWPAEWHHRAHRYGNATIRHGLAPRLAVPARRREAFSRRAKRARPSSEISM